ncbi:hypothetical protein [Intestinibacter bartlettii]|uniref:hypothetical protein n=1 Tax=Intestinibacter bartlettii TaxID=261299 RepID=UPI00248B6AF3|nr:hypothetical protein [Intestinibacter bartlettii]MDU2164335.1 hypothetical protein [Intestinibacter bartlettii]
MQKYEVSREIYNPCAGIYNFDMNFEEEVCTDNIEEVLEKWIGKKLPEFNKKVYDDGLTIEYELLLPRKERYIFSVIK